MNHRETSELLGAYALDAVESDERTEIEAHLEGCPRCRAEVQEHREAASLLAFAGSDAPEQVWDRISASLEEAPPGLRLAPVSGEAPAQRSWPRLALAAVAAAAVVASVLGVQVRNQDRRIDELQTALADPMVVAYKEALEDPDSQVIQLTSADGEISLRGAVTGDGVGFVRTTELPALGEGRTYQLWGGDGDRLISLGVLGREPRVVTFSAEQYTLFAITEEDAPGVVVSANPPVVAGGIT